MGSDRSSGCQFRQLRRRTWQVQKLTGDRLSIASRCVLTRAYVDVLAVYEPVVWDAANVIVRPVILYGLPPVAFVRGYDAQQERVRQWSQV